MHTPCFSVEEVALLIMICRGRELIHLRTVVLDDYELGRYSPQDFHNMWTLIDRKIQRGSLNL